jgi:hypothetical protein
MSGYIGNYVEISTSAEKWKPFSMVQGDYRHWRREYKPTEYLYGQSSKVMTQLEFKKRPR